MLTTEALCVWKVVWRDSMLPDSCVWWRQCTVFFVPLNRANNGHYQSVAVAYSHDNTGGVLNRGVMNLCSGDIVCVTYDKEGKRRLKERVCGLPVAIEVGPKLPSWCCGVWKWSPVTTTSAMPMNALLRCN